VLNKLSKSQQPKAKAALQEIWMATSQKEAQRAFDHFIVNYEAKYPKAVACLVKDREALTAFYDFPAEHRVHIRSKTAQSTQTVWHSICLGNSNFHAITGLLRM
jgi:putative transposase